MSITTFDELTTAVANWLDRADLTDRIPEFVALAEAQMNRVLRVHQMEARESATISSENLALPATYVDGMSIRLTDAEANGLLDPTPREVIDTFAAQTGRPRLFSMVGTDLVFYPIPDRAYTARLTYYRTLPPLSELTPTNWLLTLAPDAYLYGTLLQSAPYLVDSTMAGTWGDGFQNAIAGVQRMQRSMGGKLRTDLAGLIGHGGYDIRTDL